MFNSFIIHHDHKTSAFRYLQIAWFKGSSCFGQHSGKNDGNTWMALGFVSAAYSQDNKTVAGAAMCTCPLFADSSAIGTITIQTYVKWRLAPSEWEVGQAPAKESVEQTEENGLGIPSLILNKLASTDFVQVATRQEITQNALVKSSFSR